MYVPVAADAPLHQGDIFRELPLTEVDIVKSPIRNAHGELLAGGWFANRHETPLATEVGAASTWAVLANQDCDVGHAPALTFFAIVPLSTTGIKLSSQTSKRWRGIVKEFKANVKYYYLRKDDAVPFTEPMAVSFGQVMLLSRENINLRRGDLRRFRLSDEALVHFRDSVSRYYTRLAYDEWYSFDDEERRVYEQEHSGLG